MPATYPNKLKTQVFPTLKKNLGDVSRTCQDLGITRDTFYNWVREDEKLRANIASIENIRKDVFLDVLALTNGILLTACRTLDVSRQAVYQWMEQDDAFRLEVENVREFAKDFVESKMFEGIKAGNTQLIIFYLSRIARDRGYIEKTELEHTFSGKTLTIGFTENEYTDRT